MEFQLVTLKDYLEGVGWSDPATLGFRKGSFQRSFIPERGTTDSVFIA